MDVSARAGKSNLTEQAGRLSYWMDLSARVVIQITPENSFFGAVPCSSSESRHGAASSICKVFLHRRRLSIFET